MQKQVWIVLVVIVLIVAGFLVYYATKSQPTPSPEPSVTTYTSPATTQEQTGTSAAIPEASMTVTYTDTGFSPKSITVKLGDTVTFMNNSSKMMWVASAPHPTHTNYPEFDPKKGSTAGESYSFTFDDKAGSFNYHNHLNPTDFGTIVVE